MQVAAAVVLNALHVCDTARFFRLLANGTMALREIAWSVDARWSLPGMGTRVSMTGITFGQSEAG